MLSAEASLLLLTEALAEEDGRRSQQLQCPVCQRSHGRDAASSILVYLQATCPICLESCEPPVVALPCGHALCREDFERLGGVIGGSGEGGSSSPSSRLGDPPAHRLAGAFFPFNDRMPFLDRNHLHHQGDEQDTSEEEEEEPYSDERLAAFMLRRSDYRYQRDEDHNDNHGDYNSRSMPMRVSQPLRYSDNSPSGDSTDSQMPDLISGRNAAPRSERSSDSGEQSASSDESTSGNSSSMPQLIEFGHPGNNDLAPVVRAVLRTRARIIQSRHEALSEEDDEEDNYSDLSYLGWGISRIMDETDDNHQGGFANVQVGTGTSPRRRRPRWPRRRRHLRNQPSPGSPEETNIQRPSSLSVSFDGSSSRTRNAQERNRQRGGVWLFYERFERECILSYVAKTASANTATTHYFPLFSKMISDRHGKVWIHTPDVDSAEPEKWRLCLVKHDDQKSIFLSVHRDAQIVTNGHAGVWALFPDGKLYHLGHRQKNQKRRRPCLEDVSRNSKLIPDMRGGVWINVPSDVPEESGLHPGLWHIKTQETTFCRNDIGADASIVHDGSGGLWILAPQSSNQGRTRRLVHQISPEASDFQRIDQRFSPRAQLRPTSEEGVVLIYTPKYKQTDWFLWKLSATGIREQLCACPEGAVVVGDEAGSTWVFAQDLNNADGPQPFNLRHVDSEGQSTFSQIEEHLLRCQNWQLCAP